MQLSNQGNPQTDNVISFGPFKLNIAQRLLARAGTPIHLGARAFDILAVLVEHAGKVVGKNDLIARVWPNVTVDEGSVRVHIAALRKALGDGELGARYVMTLSGQGYCFVAPVFRTSTPEPVPARDQIRELHNLPARLGRMIGRDDTAHEISSRLLATRFVTIVGTGGIGKTTVAVAVAHRLLADLSGAVGFFDLGPLKDPLLVPGVVAATLGLSVQSNDPTPGLINFLQDKRMLLVFDSCEHVMETAAALTERIFAEAPQVYILATSREPLRVEGEEVHRLPLLGNPPADPGLLAAQALEFSAVQLFVERVVAGGLPFELNDTDAPVVGEICRRLDGIPLAIELAAGCVKAYSIRETLKLLNNRFNRLREGRRTALPRHQTLSATLDWSYDLLPEPERLILRRLSVFVGFFRLEAAGSVAASVDIDGAQAVIRVASLVDKSLITASHVGGATMYYRLLDTTRAYALAKLSESGESDAIARRHGEYYRNLFVQAEAEAEVLPADQWLANYGPQIHNVRAVLDWAFSPTGDVAIGVELTAAAVPLWIQLSLYDECRSRAERALASLNGRAGRDERREMHLLFALGVARLYANTEAGSATESARADDRGRTWFNALHIAEQLRDVDYRLRALWGLWIHHFNNGEHRVALAFARQFHDLAEKASDPAEAFVGDRMIAFSLQLLGDASGARQHIERMLKGYIPPANRSHIVRFQFDQLITARITLAQTLWIQGWPHRALRVVASNVDEALAVGHTMSLCNALAQAACPIALFTGDLSAAERYVALLVENTARQGLGPWHLWGRCFQGRLAAMRGDLAGGLRTFRAALGDLPPNRFALRYTAFLGELSEMQSLAGEFDQSVASIERALERSERHEENWCIPELLRIRAEIACRQNPKAKASVAEELLRQSLDWARRQEALSWELRTATSLARLWKSQDRRDAARDLLQPVYDRFSEGFDTADLKAAKALLDELA